MHQLTACQWVLLLMALFIGQALASPSVYVVSPSPAARYLLNPGESTLTVPFQYQLFGASDANWQICLDLKYSKNGQVFLPFTCLPPGSDGQNHNINLNNVLPGQYEVKAVVKSTNEQAALADTAVTNCFHVLSYEDTVPKLIVADNSNPQYLAADLTTGTADFSLDYDLQAVAAEAAAFTVCVQMSNQLTKQIMLPYSCLSNADRNFILRNLLPGAYQLAIVLKDTQPSQAAAGQQTAGNALLAANPLVRDVFVKPLQELLPQLVVDQKHLEYAANGAGTASATVSYALQGVRSAKAQVKVCVELQQIHPVRKQLIAKGCLEDGSTSFSLSNLPAGQHEGKLWVEDKLRGQLQGPAQAIAIDIQLPSEFKPSYDWRLLHAWHTIPSGVETRLPIGGSGHKEARIPVPWRLQLPMPSPCKYFLRMDIQRSTTVQQIM